MISSFRRLYVFCTIFLPFFFILNFTVFSISIAEENKFLRVINNQTILYSDSNGTLPVVYLPYTYYVKVINFDQNFYHVECFGVSSSPILDGYVLKSELFDDNTSPINPYLNLEVTTQKNCVLYADTELTSLIQYVFPDRKMNYYGCYKNTADKYVCLVGYNGKLGYIEEELLTPFSIENHPNELTFLITENEPIAPVISEGVSNSSEMNGLKIAIICCLALAGLIALIISIKPRKKQQKENFYDENDYE